MKVVLVLNTILPAGCENITNTYEYGLENSVRIGSRVVVNVLSFCVVSHEVQVWFHM